MIFISSCLSCRIKYTQPLPKWFPSVLQQLSSVFPPLLLSSFRLKNAVETSHRRDRIVSDENQLTLDHDHVDVDSADVGLGKTLALLQKVWHIPSPNGVVGFLAVGEELPHSHAWKRHARSIGHVRSSLTAGLGLEVPCGWLKSQWILFWKSWSLRFREQLMLSYWHYCAFRCASWHLSFLSSNTWLENREQRMSERQKKMWSKISRCLKIYVTPWQGSLKN